MKIDRFKNYDEGVRDLVLRFECQDTSGSMFFDVAELEVIMDYYLEVYDDEGLEAAVVYGEGLYPYSGEIRLRRAHLMSIRGQYDSAVRILEELVQAEPDNTDVCYALGAVYSMMERAEDAIICYERAAVDGYELDMVYGNIGDEYYKLGKKEKAALYYRKAVDVNPEEGRSVYNLACTECELGKGEDVTTFFKMLVDDRPYNKWAWLGLGLVYSKLHLWERGADAYEFAIAIDGTLFDAYLGLADCYMELGDNGKAVQTLRESLEYTDDRAYVFFCIGNLYRELGNLHTATVYLHDALKEDPSYGDAWLALGQCSQQLGYGEEAAGYYRRAIDLNPDSDEGWLCLADLYIGEGCFAEAAALMESGYADAVTPLLFASRLCYCYYRMGRRERLADFLLSANIDLQSVYFQVLAVYPDLAGDTAFVEFLTGLDCDDEKKLNNKKCN